MTQEDYCSFEVAKLLKEKGFNGECFAYHLEKDNILGEYGKTPHIASSIITYSILHDDVLLCPTHQMIMKWLREVHNIFIVIEPHAYDYVNEKTSSYVFAIWEGDNYMEVYSYKNSGLRGISYLTYEEAVEAALKYSLENLM